METIGRIASRIGIRTSAIRYYESQGLLRSSRLPNGYRAYGEEALSALRFIRRAQTLGISLAETKELLRLSGQGRPPCGRVRELTRDHLHDIDRKIRELTALRAQLRRLLRRRPSSRRAGEVCPMIQRETPLEQAATQAV
jgi:DNA-binding transcriptional MerR regulator